MDASGNGGASNGGARGGGIPSVAQVSDVVHRRSPAMFAVVAVCFVLPFVSFACSGQRILTFSGLQLVTGTEVSSQEIQEDIFGGDPGEIFGTPSTPAEDETERVEPEGLAILALAAAVLGAAGGFMKGRARSTWSTIAAVGGALSLLALKIKLDGDIEEEGEGIVSLEYRFGFWIALVLFVVLAVVHVRWLRGKSPPEPARPPPAAPVTRE